MQRLLGLASSDTISSPQASLVARRYDGDSRIAFIHLGLLGFWGEWHTFPVAGLVPDTSKESITDAYLAAFSTTKLQGRYADDFEDNDVIGLYDGSFAFSTLDGESNGGVEHSEWYFWPVVKNLDRDDFWRKSPMGGTYHARSILLGHF